MPTTRKPEAGQAFAPARQPQPAVRSATLDKIVPRTASAVWGLRDALLRAGVRAEDTVTIAVKTSGIAMRDAILAVALCGARALPLPPDCAPEMAGAIAARAKARLALISAGAAAPAGVRQCLSIESLLAEAAGKGQASPIRAVATEGAVVMGATDTAAGAVFGQTALVHAASGVVQRHGLTSRDRILVLAPVGGAEWLTWALASVASGAELLDPPDADPEDLLHEIAAARPSVLAVPDPIRMLALVQDDDFDAALLPSLRLLRADGPADLMRRLADDLPGVRRMSALSLPLVAGFAASSDPRDPAQDPEVTLGRPAPGLEVMIVNPATGKDMLLYEIGEIWLRGPQVFSGFLHDPAAAAGLLEADGFLRSGVQGYLDREGRVVLA